MKNVIKINDFLVKFEPKTGDFHAFLRNFQQKIDIKIDKNGEYFYIDTLKCRVKKIKSLMNKGIGELKLKSRSKRKSKMKKVKEVKVFTLLCDDIPTIEKDYGIEKRIFSFEPSTLEKLKEFLTNNNNICLDIETNTLLQYKPFAECLLIALHCATNGETWLVGSQYTYEVVSVLNSLKNKNYIIHNAAFDVQFLMNYGLEHNNIFIKDTMILSKLAENDVSDRVRGYGLKKLLLEQGVHQDNLGANFAEQEQKKNEPAISYVNISTNYYVYGVSDVLDLYSIQNSKLHLLKDKDTYMEEEQFLHTLLDMCRVGIPIDKNTIPSAVDNAFEEVDKIVKSTPEFINFHNINNLKKVFIEKGYELPPTKSGNLSLTDDWLKKEVESDKDDIRLLHSYIEFKKQSKTCELLAKDKQQVYTYNSKAEIKIKSAGVEAYYKKDQEKYEKGLVELKDVKLKKQYQILDEEGLEQYKLTQIKSNFKRKGNLCVSLSDQLDENDRVHPSIQQLGAATGRMSMNNPNMQSFPKRYRKLVTAPEGRKILAIDFSGQEIYVAAVLSGCNVIMDKYLSGDYHTLNTKILYKIVEGEDISDLTTSEVKELIFKNTDLKQRDVAKMIGLGITYGLSADAALKRLGLPKSYKPTIQKIINILMTPKLIDYQIKKAHEYICKGYFTQGCKGEYYFGNKGLRDNILSLQNANLYTDRESTLVIEASQSKDDFYYDLDRLRQCRNELNGVLVNKIKNYPIQGTSAASVKQVLNRLIPQIKENNLDLTLINIVHDEMVFEVSEDISQETIDVIKTKIVDLTCEYFNTDKRINLEETLEKYQKK